MKSQEQGVRFDLRPSQLLRQGVRFSGSSLAFVFSKATVFLGPLMLSAALGVREYGMFEYALAWATPLAVFLEFGCVGALPYFVLKRKWPVYMQVFYLHVMLTAVLVVVGNVVCASLHLGYATYLSVLATCAIAMQVIYAVAFKVWGKPARASISESGLYVVLASVTGVYATFHWKLNLNVLLIAFNCYAAALVVPSFLAFHWSCRWPHTLRRYGKAIRFGFPLIFTTMFMGFLTSSGRLLVGKFLTMQDVGVYSFFFRISAGVVVLHQLLLTILFSKLYQSEGKHLDKYFSTMSSAIFVLTMALFLSTPHFLGYFFPLMRDLKPGYLPVYYALATQMVFWVCTANAEFIIYRQNLAARFWMMLVGMIALLLTGTVLLKVTGTLTLLRLCQLHMVCIYANCLAQMYLLRCHGVRLSRMAVVTTAVMVFYAMTQALVH